MGKPRYRGFTGEFGFWRPQIQVQITPLCWGIGGGFSRSKIALKIGPIAIAVWFGLNKDFRRTFYKINDPDF